MAIYAISDLHLSLGINKPMDIFGGAWANYMERLKTNWSRVISDEDYIIVPGDISWATYLDQAVEDFRFIESLPGRKIVSKGNHDYWWTTLNKLEKFLAENKFETIDFLHNNSLIIENSVLCGTRGWKCPGDEGFSAEDRKIFNRELQRLELSLKSSEAASDKGIIVALHYPPFNSKKEPSEFVDMLIRYGVKKCVYGHLHGEGFKNAVVGEYLGVSFELISSDFLKFEPLKLL